MGAYLWATIAVAIFLSGIWLLSLRLKDVSIVDQCWGPCFAIAMGTFLWNQESVTLRGAVAFVLISVWALRLSFHIHRRHRGAGEDFRYRKMRQHHGPLFWWVSFFTVFLLQGALALIIAAPLWAIATDSSGTWLLTDSLGLFLWLVGFLCEALADHQLTRFKRDPQNRGKLLTTGLWSLSRHPNYFGDSLVWWGIFALALGTERGIFTVFAPVLMNFLLLKVSGVALLEKSLRTEKPGYENYMASTPAFWPNPMQFFRRKP